MSTRRSASCAGQSSGGQGSSGPGSRPRTSKTCSSMTSCGPRRRGRTRRLCRSAVPRLDRLRRGREPAPHHQGGHGDRHRRLTCASPLLWAAKHCSSVGSRPAPTSSSTMSRGPLSLAVVAPDHDLVVTHGNGPQVGLLALESASDRTLERLGNWWWLLPSVSNWSSWRQSARCPPRGPSSSARVEAGFRPAATTTAGHSPKVRNMLRGIPPARS